MISVSFHMSMPFQPKYEEKKSNKSQGTFIVHQTTCNELLHTNQIFINFCFQSTTNRTSKVWSYSKKERAEFVQFRPLHAKLNS